MRRSRFEIVCELLKTCKMPSSPTKLMYKSNLSYVCAKGYLEMLEKKGLIEHEGYGYYILTQFGSEFLEGLEILLSLWYGIPQLPNQRVM